MDRPLPQNVDLIMVRKCQRYGPNSNVWPSSCRSIFFPKQKLVKKHLLKQRQRIWCQTKDLATLEGFNNHSSNYSVWMVLCAMTMPNTAYFLHTHDMYIYSISTYPHDISNIKSYKSIIPFRAKFLGLNIANNRNLIIESNLS